jgi:hypothetical protein
MPSELKSETSRINGAKSLGPKTPEGKEASSRNALKHGFTEAKTFILECESPDEYQEFLAEHMAIHQPATPAEKELVDQMAIARWRIRRFVAAETALLDSEMLRNRDAVNQEFGPTHSDVHLAMAIRSLADDSRALSLMSRYESRHQRTHDKAYAALRELQKSRTSQPPAAAPEPTPSVEKTILRNEPTTAPGHVSEIPFGAPVEPLPDLPIAPKSGNSEVRQG